MAKAPGASLRTKPFYVAEMLDGTYLRKANRDHRWRSQKELAKVLEKCLHKVARVYLAEEKAIAEVAVADWVAGKAGAKLTG